MTLYSSAAQILRTIHFGTLATVSGEGQPWNCPLMMVYDDDLDFYWFSDINARHSQNLRANPGVSIVLFDSRVEPGKKLDRALYIEGMGEELTGPDDIDQAMAALHRLDPKSPYQLTGSRRAYRATPTHIWTNDIEVAEGRFKRDLRVELVLPGLRVALHEATR